MRGADEIEHRAIEGRHDAARVISPTREIEKVRRPRLTDGELAANRIGQKLAEFDAIIVRNQD